MEAGQEKRDPLDPLNLAQILENKTSDVDVEMLDEDVLLRKTPETEEAERLQDEQLRQLYENYSRLDLLTRGTTPGSATFAAQGDGEDGEIRSVTLLCKKREVKRSVNQLIPLEIGEEEDEHHAKLEQTAVIVASKRAERSSNPEKPSETDRVTENGRTREILDRKAKRNVHYTNICLAAAPGPGECCELVVPPRSQPLAVYKHRDPTQEQQ